jgi:hypothetical protein
MSEPRQFLVTWSKLIDPSMDRVTHLASHIPTARSHAEAVVVSEAYRPVDADHVQVQALRPWKGRLCRGLNVWFKWNVDQWVPLATPFSVLAEQYERES